MSQGGRWYVERSFAHPFKRGYTGPLSERQARREVQAWNDAGWSAAMLPSTPTVRKMVRDWQHEADHRHGRCACKAGARRWPRAA